MKSYLQKAILIIALFSLWGCASKENNITYVPPIKYQNYTCDQIRKKLDNVYERLNALSSIHTDLFMPVVTILDPEIAIPALVSGGGAHKKDIAQLRGDAVALKQIATEKRCTDALEFIEEQRKKAVSTPSASKKSLSEKQDETYIMRND